MKNHFGGVPPRYCTDEKLRVWNLGPSVVCDGQPDGCEWLVQFGKQAYCGHCPPRVTLHQVVRGQAGCLWCKWATRNLDSARCLPCLSADTRINFQKEDEV